MNILVIGHPCFDVIERPDGNQAQAYGGIYYAVATLASLADEQTKVIPVFPVGGDEYEAYIEDLSRYPAVDPAGIYRYEGPSNRVFLNYDAHGERVECSKNIFPAIPFSKVQLSLARADGIIVNMISGSDIELETLDEIRMAVRERRIPIHLDIHSLTLGIDDRQRRFRRPVPVWRRWCFMADTVQMNEEEASHLTPERLSEENLVLQLLALGGRNFIITRGERGATVYQQEHKHIQRHDILPPIVSSVVDPTGSGDVFGAAFSYRYFRDRDTLAAARFANEVAGISVEHIGPSGLQEVNRRYSAKQRLSSASA